MPLTTYDGVRPWAKAIRDEVISRRMPPWGAVKGFGEFRDDISLTQDEITRIAEWVEGGAPEGDPRLLPASLPERLSARKVPDGISVRVRYLARAGVLLGIRPLSDVTQAKITAVRPDGTVEPLLWLLNFRKATERTFLYRQPVSLPRGTKIVSEVPLELLFKRR
jgi:hypothetical protein